MVTVVDLVTKLDISRLEIYTMLTCVDNFFPFWALL